MKKPIDPNLERFEDSVFSLTGGDDTSGVSYRAPQFEMKETSAAATPGEYHASENHRHSDSGVNLKYDRYSVGK